MIHRNRVFWLGKVHICVMPGNKVIDLVIFKNCFSKQRNVPTLKGGLFSNCQELLFQNSKRPDMSSAFQQEDRCAEAHETHFHGAKSSSMCNAVQQGVDYLLLMKRVFKLWNAVASYIFYSSGIKIPTAKRYCMC